MSTTLEAETDIAAAEAAAAIEAEEAAALEAHETAELARRAEELEAAAAAGQFTESAGITAETEAGEAASLTQEQREASAEHDGPPDTEKPKRRSRAKKKDEQGTLAGGWEELIGGNMDNELKLALSKPAAVQLENVPEKLLKGSVHRLVLTVKVTGFGSDDTLDPATHDVSTTKGSRKLRVTSGSFLEADEYITRDEEGTDVAAEAATDEEPEQ